jgi:S-formylglutathione hydrolase FrmB
VFAVLLHSSVIHGAIPITIEVLCLAALVVVVSRRPVKRWGLRFAIAAVLGGALGFGLAWYLGDVKNDFGIILAFSTRAWFAAGIAGAAVAGVSLWRAPKWRISVGIVSIVLFGIAATVGINATIGEYPNIADALGINKVHPLHISRHFGRGPVATPDRPLWESWHPAADMPAKGKIGTVDIPATASHFAARPAVVYLPPAALASNAPRLPVLIFLGGQPGSPETVLDAGQLPEIMNAFAAAHDGLAPIVVIPDQLGGDAQNPMCLDSPLGNVATYLTVDVPNWIKAHLAVQTGAQSWAVGGFSEGGTCSIQLGTKYRSQFGSILDISGQVAPLNGSIDHTIRVGFGGSVAAYRAGTAPALLAAGAPFSTTLGIFAVGQDDAKYGPDTAIVERAARAAKMNVHALVSPGTAHDWFTEQYGLRYGLPILAQQWGLTP